jgi:pilus assembly protein FimV
MDELRNDEIQDEELERYGVWVKAGPEEVIETDETFAFADLPQDDPSVVEPLPDDSFSGPGDGSDDDFEDLTLDDLDELDLPSSEESSPADVSAAEIADDDDLVTLDDFDIEVPEEDPDPFESLTPEESDGTDEGDEPDDLDLDQLAEELPDDYETLELDENTDAGPMPTEELEGFDSSIPGSDDELSDISLDDIAIGDGSEDLPELEVETLDMDGDDDTAFGEVEPDFDSLEEPSDAADEHDFTPEEQGIEIVPTGPQNRLTPDEEEFLNEELDLQNDAESAIPPTMELQEREAFERIQTELTDIKKELAELKAALRAGSVMPTEPVPEDTPLPAQEELLDETEEIDGQMGPGFFEEDEDETIALTGDELDNILNTAEFTEQAGEAEELEDDFLEDPAIAAPGLDVDAEVDLQDEAEEAPFDDVEAVEDATTSEETDEPVSEIDLEPVDRQSVVFEGDETAIDELAEMDIDSELADIESLKDDTSIDETDELEIDLDALDDVETSGVLDEQAEDAALEASAAADQEALNAVGADEIGEVDVEDGAENELVIDASDEEDDFDQFAAAVEDDLASGEAGVELDDEFDIDSDEEDDVPEAESDLEQEIEIELDDIDDFDMEDEEPEHVPSSDELVVEEENVMSLDDSDVELGIPETDQSEVLEEAVDEEPGFTDVAVETDLESATAEAPSDPLRGGSSISDLPEDLKQEIRSVLSYMDQLLEALPDDKIEEFAHSEHFEVYKRLFEELGLET